jgi:hypothetical protein
MEIAKTRISRQGKNVLVVEGRITSIEDYVGIRDGLNSLIEEGNQELTLKIVDSKTITSSVIGFLMKLVNHDKIKVTIEVGAEELYKSLATMHLTELFNVTKI